MNKQLLLKIVPHAVALALFVILASAYFSPVWKGYELRQGDIDHWRGMSKEIADYRLLNEQEPLWTNSMFGGMPAYQISTEHSSNLLRPVMLVFRLGLPGPVGTLFLAMLGFYIFALCLRINPWLSIAGAVAFGFSTINILYLGAGHTAKVSAIALMPPVLGGLILAFRGKALLGASIFMLFLGLQITANHLQMTYYLAILCGAVGLSEIIRLMVGGSFKTAIQSSALLAVGAIVAVLPAMSNLLTTAEYGKYTTRGESELTITPEGEEREESDKVGLDGSYILDYNFARGEQWSLLIPNAKGGESAAIGSNKEAMGKVNRQFKENIAQQNQYWGAQRFTGGAFYFGAITMLLFALGLIFVKDSLKWPFLVLTLMALALCVKDMSGVNQFFINSFPLYNKFRDSKMILVIIQVMAPAMALLFVQQMIRGELFTSNKKIVFGGMAAVLAIVIIVSVKPEITGSLLTTEEVAQFESFADQAGTDSAQIAMIEDYQEALITARKSIFTSDASRTLLFAFLGISVAVLAFLKVIKELPAGLLLLVLLTADLWSVNQRYLNSEKQKNTYASYVKKDDKLIPYKPSTSDQYILAMQEPETPDFAEKKKNLREAMDSEGAYEGVKNKELLDEIAAFGALNLSTDYRVLNLNNPFNDAATSYYHKSVGGYHGAKLKRYQEVIDFYIQSEIRTIIDSLTNRNPLPALENAPVLNMLNTKYVLYNPEAPALENPFAQGNAWFVREVIPVATANEEILALATIDPTMQAVVRESQQTAFNITEPADTAASIRLQEYGTNLLRYVSNSYSKGAVVFSEIYYSEGWICRIDGKEVETACVNYILRGANVPSGEHTIEWSFEPKVWTTGKTVSLAGSLLLLALLLFTGFHEIREQRRS